MTIFEGMKNKVAMKAIEKLPGVKKESGFIKWNFTKFLVNRQGEVVARFSPTYRPEDMASRIAGLIEEKS